jgi:hypothetical protein
MKKKDYYKNIIGDGKLPNKYFVFQYDQKYKRIKDEDGNINIGPVSNDVETKDSFLGEFETFKDALRCVDNKAYLPNVVIEDRITGQIFEHLCIVCDCCGKEEYETNRDEKYTKKHMEAKGLVFE